MVDVRNSGWKEVDSELKMLANLEHKPQGPKHMPVPHNYAVNFFRERLAENKIAIEKERILLSPDTMRLIYLADVIPADGAANKDFAFSVGFINNNDRSMAFTGIAGTRVYVNSAEFYVSQDAFKTRHVKTVYELLTDRVASIITWFKDYYNAQSGRIEEMKSIKVTDSMLGKLLLKYVRERYVLSSTNIKNIVKEYDKPRYEDFKPRTLWSLRNTTNEVFKRVKSPLFRLDAMNVFDDFIEDILGKKIDIKTNQEKMVAE